MAAEMVGSADRVAWFGRRVTTQVLWLHPHELRRAEAAEGPLEVVCLTGQVWLTAEGDPHDYLLQTGDRFRCGCHGLVLVQALSEAEVSVRGG